MNKSSVSRTQRFTYFQILYYVLERWTRTHNQILHGKTDCANTTLHKTIFAAWISTRNSRTGQKVNKFGALTASEFVTQSDRPNKMCNELKHWGNPRVHPMTRERCGLNHSWACLFLYSFVFVSVSVPWLFLQMYAHYIGSRADRKLRFTFIPHCTSMCRLVVSAVLDLFDFSIHFISFLISLITLLFLLPDTFNFQDVVDKCLAHFRWGPRHPGRE